MLAGPSADLGAAATQLRPSIVLFADQEGAAPARRSSRVRLKNVLTEIRQDDYSASVRSLVTFAGCQDLLRGAEVGRVLRRGAGVFRNGDLDTALYELSRPVEELDAFVSHNWASSRWSKFCILSLHFNSSLATIFAIAVMTLVAVLGRLGFLPESLETEMHESHDRVLSRTWMARVVTIPSFFFVTFFVRDVCPCFRGPCVFVDKTCIAQEDKNVQRKGIEKLAAFLANSKTMVVCYSDIYLTKLWTVFEVASYLSLFRVDRLILLPLRTPLLVYGALASWYVAEIAAILILELAPKIPIADAGSVNLVFIPFFLLAVAFVLRHAVRSKVAIGKVLEGFSVQRCTCFDEADRPIVYNNIATLIRETHGLEGDSPEEEALACFDRLVRSELPRAITKGFGRFDLTYRFMLTQSFFALVPRVVDRAVSVGVEISMTDFLPGFMLYYAFLIFSFWPFAFAAADVLASQFLRWTGCREVLWLICCALVVGLAMLVVIYVLQKLSDAATESRTWLALYIVLDIVTGVAAFLVVTDWRRIRRKPKRGPEFRGTAVFRPTTSAKLLRGAMRLFPTSVGGLLAGLGLHRGELRGGGGQIGESPQSTLELDPVRDPDLPPVLEASPRELASQPTQSPSIFGSWKDLPGDDVDLHRACV